MRRSLILGAAAAGLFAASADAQRDEYRSRYKVGQKVMFSISGSPGDFQPCVVTENHPDSVMRVRCGAFRNWSAGTYIAYGASYVRPGGAAQPQPTPANPKPPRVAAKPASPRAAAPTPAAAGGGLKVGEYACYGSGGRIMIGLGFKVLAGGRYTDLEGGNAGRYSVSGGNVRFQGGHLDGQVGRNLRSGSFAIGAQAECEPF